LGSTKKSQFILTLNQRYNVKNIDLE